MTKTKFYLVAILLLSSISIALIAYEYESLPVLEFNNSLGKVTFQHEAHQARLGGCDSCHPAFPQVYNDSVSIKDQAHVTCKGCHEQRGAGPTKCMQCHVK